MNIAGYVTNEQELDEWLKMEPISINDMITVAYDDLPRTKMLHSALMNGLKIEFTYDRTGWSKTGFVYRVIKSEGVGELFK